MRTLAKVPNAKSAELVEAEEWINKYGKPQQGSDMYMVWKKESGDWNQARNAEEKSAYDRCMKWRVWMQVAPLSPTTIPSASTIGMTNGKWEATPTGTKK